MTYLVTHRLQTGYILCNVLKISTLTVYKRFFAVFGGMDLQRLLRR